LNVLATRAPETARFSVNTREDAMKTLWIGLVLAALIPTAYGQQGAKTQQDRMAECNQQAGAKQLKGDERKAFMSSCLGGKSTEPARTAQQDRMANCNKQAGEKGLKGDERKAFMSTCLKGN
jgi:hypothetical protein